MFDEISVTIDFNRPLDCVVICCDLVTLLIVLRRIWQTRSLEGWELVYLRAALGVVSVAMLYQIASCAGRVIGQPLNGDYSSGWALKDFSLFMYITALQLFMWRVGMKTTPNSSPPVAATERFIPPTEGVANELHQRIKDRPTHRQP